jgi:hypothetical protein
MPFQSKAQKKYLYSQRPEVAEKFEKEEKKGSYKKATPERKEAIRRRLMKKVKK